MVGQSYIGREGRADPPKLYRITRLAIEEDQVQGYTQRVFNGGVLGLEKYTPTPIQEILDSMATREREMERLRETEWTLSLPEVQYGETGPH